MKACNRHAKFACDHIMSFCCFQKIGIELPGDHWLSSHILPLAYIVYLETIEAFSLDCTLFLASLLFFPKHLAFLRPHVTYPKWPGSRIQAVSWDEPMVRSLEISGEAWGQSSEVTYQTGHIWFSFWISNKATLNMISHWIARALVAQFAKLPGNTIE